MKKIIGLILLLLLIGIACIGCGASSETEFSPDQPAVSEGTGGDADQQGEGQGAAESPTNADSAGNSTSGQNSGEGQSGSPGSGGQDGRNPVDESPGQQSESSLGKANAALKCTFSINCSTVFDNLDKISSGIVELLPEDGWIYSAKEVEFTEGESVFDILLRVTRQESIHMESNSNPALNSKYVEGIHNLYEFDAGELSGWTYKINGKGMGYGSSSSYPKNGDIIEWVYTCDQGRDVGVTP